ncbi:MAG: ATP-binding protein [Thermoanaerobaculia bacterium]
MSTDTEEELRASRGHLQLIDGISTAITTRVPVEKILRQAVNGVHETFSEFRAAYASIDDTGRLRIMAAREPAGMQPIEGLESHLGVAPEYLAHLRRNELAAVEDIDRDSRLAPLAEVLKAGGTRAVLDVPVHHSGRLVGLLCLDSSEPHGWSENQIATLSSVAGSLAVAVKSAEDEALRDTGMRYRTLFEESRDAIFISTPEGRLVDVNPAAIELFGYSSKEELLDADIARDLYLDPTGRKAWLLRLEQQGFVKDHELVLRTRQGRRLHVLETASAVLGEAGEVLGYQGILRDVTEERELERRLGMSQKLEAVGRLAGGVAHDFNNLLTAVIGYSELVLARLGTDDPVRLDLEQIKKAGDRAASLTRQLLAFSRQQVLRPKLLNLNELILDIESLLRRTIGEDIELTTALEAKLWCVKADPSQVDQILMNLAVNSRDAMPDGGKLIFETANVVLDDAFAASHEGASTGPHVVISVTDSGFGMDETTRSRLFEPFFTTKEQGRGTGLGLATVYGIVKQSGGYVWVDSETGRGTTFKIYLPRVEGSIENECDGQRAGDAARGGSETVLLVEDDEGVRRLAARVLSRSGYEVLQARHPSEALEIATHHEGSIGLLLTDLVMPTMSGTQLSRRITDLRPEVRVLYMSGYAPDRVSLREEIGSALPLLGKPFTREALLRTVRDVLEGTSTMAEPTGNGPETVVEQAPAGAQPDG